MTKHITLMADYGGKMLWRRDPETVGPIDPERLALTSETVARLRQWAEVYDASLNWDDPASTPPWNAEKLDEFENEGVSLWLRLRQELSPEYEVKYFSERLRVELLDPSELKR